MRFLKMTLLLCALSAASACGGGGGAQNSRTAPAQPAPAQTPPAAAASLPKSATCGLISAEEFREVEGEEPSDAQGTEHTAAGLSMSQCFYRLPTFSKAVNLEVVRPAEGAPADALKNSWGKLFGPDSLASRERRLAREEAAKAEREELLKREREAGGFREGGKRRKKDRETEDAPPRRVEGVGLEAFWAGNRTAASLYVLSKGVVLRVSPAAGEEEDVKLRKASELARRVLKRL